MYTIIKVPSLVRKAEIYKKTVNIPHLYVSRKEKKNHLVIGLKVINEDTAITIKKEITRAIQRMKHSGIEISYEMHMDLMDVETFKKY